MATSAPTPPVDAVPGEPVDAETWAELYRLREAVKGPKGFATWQDAAVDERHRRVKAEAALAASVAVPVEPVASAAARDLLAERRRQVEAEGYSADHDAAHGTSELSLAAAAYALSSVHGLTAKSLSPWPWETRSFKPKHPYRDLERAGALVLAAMECWQRRLSKNLAFDQEFIESRRLAASVASRAPCQHRIADARNAHVQSGYVCLDCGALFRAADHDVASRAGSEPAKWGYAKTVGNAIAQLQTMDASLPFYAALHLEDGRCIARGVTFSRERVVNERWIDNRNKDVPYSIVVWSQPVESLHSTASIAPAAAAEPSELTTCNCRWKGEKLVQQCTLHEAWRDAIRDWSERAKVAERQLPDRERAASLVASEDTKRLDWIESKVCDVSRLGDSGRTVRISWNNGADSVFVGPGYSATWREAIDQASAGEAQS